MKSLGARRRFLDAPPSVGSEIDESGFESPAEKSAHCFQEIVCRKRRGHPAVPRVGDRLTGDHQERLFAGRIDNMKEDILALLPRRRRKRRPCHGVTISAYQPSQRSARDGCAFRQRALSRDRGEICRRKIRSPVFPADADPPIFPFSEIPDRRSMARIFQVKVWQPRARHVRARPR